MADPWSLHASLLASTVVFLQHSFKIYTCQCTEHTKDTVMTKVSRCVPCGKDYCEACWDRVDPHKGTSSRTSHVRNEPRLVDRLKDALEAPERTAEQQQNVHQDDVRNLWFGVTEHDGSQYIYEGRSYEDLVFGNVAVQPWGMYPGLVTFVGDTGAGKSTLIKLLIDLVDLRGRRSNFWATPIVGNIADDLTPTSADVHLYADPGSLIFYADCEGLEGGEQVPIAAQCAATSDDILLERIDRFTPKRIAWAHSGRQIVVQSLYPRLLYSFSDTIVFVLECHKKFEQVVIDLVDWGHQVIEKACNQSVLPHAIIVLNKSPSHSVDKERWETESTTKDLLHKALAALKKKDKLQEKVRFWEERNVPINTAEDLLKRYYASITAIRIPNAQPPALVESQINKLHKIIKGKSEESQKKRLEECMQLNAVDLHLYLRKAFEHFAAKVDEPFDFIKASFDINPGSASFGLASGISNLANIVQKCLGYPGCYTILNHIIPFVASCMCLSAYRLPNITGVGNSEGIFRHFWDDCESAIREFYDKKLRCEYRSHKIEACVNVKNAHRKGHQSAHGTIEGGDWKCSQSYSEIANDIRDKLHTKVQEIGQEYRDYIRSDKAGEGDELCKAYRYHKIMVHRYQESLGEYIASFKSHFTCLSCLMEAPEHTLPCGHTLCTSCVSAAGRSLGSGFFETESCPLDKVGVMLDPLYRAAVKPAQAGVRILTLDGGGVRGIIELEILRAIELELDDKVPIQAFFDLIVGTSTGGIISLGLGHKGWTVAACAAKFREMAQDAFRPHRAGLFSKIRTATKYRTDLFTGALESSFSADEALFGSEKAPNGVRIKTAVVTATPTGPVTLFSNYNRRVSESERYEFFRGADQSEEIKIYESARATSAAPWYWETYSHGAFGQVYLDGGVSHNNPIRIADSEQKLIWPDRKYSHPDILVSVGTGHHDIASATAGLKNNSSGGPFGLAKTGWSIGSKLFDERLDSERIWQDWIETRMPTPEHRNRYRRINIPLGFAPDMDNIAEMETYAELARKHVKNNEHDIRGIAHQLIASCFYFRFDKEKLHWKNERWTCEGHIECRLPPGDPISKGFGEILQKLSQVIKNEKVPGMKKSPTGLCFCVTEMHLDRNESFREMTQDVIDNMQNFGRFEMPPIEITITSEAAETYIFMLLHHGKGGQIPISGFPRNLLKDFPDTYRKRKPKKDSGKPDVTIIRKFFLDLKVDVPKLLQPGSSRKQLERHARSKDRLSVEEVTSSRPLSETRDSYERTNTTEQ